MKLKHIIYLLIRLLDSWPLKWERLVRRPLRDEERLGRSTDQQIGVAVQGKPHSSGDNPSRSRASIMRTRSMLSVTSVGCTCNEVGHGLIAWRCATHLQSLRPLVWETRSGCRGRPRQSLVW